MGALGNLCEIFTEDGAQTSHVDMAQKKNLILSDQGGRGKTKQC